MMLMHLDCIWFGSVRFGSVRFGSVRFGWFAGWFGWLVRFRLVRLQVRKTCGSNRFGFSRVKTPRVTPSANDLKKGAFTSWRLLAHGRAMEGQAAHRDRAGAAPTVRCHCGMRSGFSPSDEDEGGGTRECHDEWRCYP